MVVLAKLTSKGQATIPEPIRKRLKLTQGDQIAFVVEGEQVTLRRADPVDAGFLKLAGDSFADWSSKEADEDLFMLAGPMKQHGSTRTPIPAISGYAVSSVWVLSQSTPILGNVADIPWFESCLDDVVPFLRR